MAKVIHLLAPSKLQTTSVNRCYWRVLIHSEKLTHTAWFQLTQAAVPSLHVLALTDCQSPAPPASQSCATMRISLLHENTWDGSFGRQCYSLPCVVHLFASFARGSFDAMFSIKEWDESGQNCKMRSNSIGVIQREHLNLGMGSLGWPQMNAVSFDLTQMSIRSTSGVDSRPSGFISVRSTFESHDRPHRTC